MPKAGKHKTYNMSDLANDLSAEFGLSKQDGVRKTRFIFDRIKDNLAAGAQVRLHQFGTVAVRKRKARLGRNPKTKQSIQVPERSAIKLTPSPALKELLR